MRPLKACISEFAYSILYPKITSEAPAVIAEDINEVNHDAVFLKIEFLECFYDIDSLLSFSVQFKHTY